MNPEALEYSYNLFKKDGYNGSLEDYKQLLASNEEAKKYSYGLFSSDGYNGSIEEFSSLVLEPANAGMAASPFLANAGGNLTGRTGQPIVQEEQEVAVQEPAIEDEVVEEAVVEPEIPTPSADVLKFMEDQLQQYGHYYKWNGEKTWRELYDNYDDFAGKPDITSEERIKAKNEISELRKQHQIKEGNKYLAKEKRDKSNITPEDFQKGEDEFVDLMNTKYADRGIKFSIPTKFGDYVEVTPLGGKPKTFKLGSGFNYWGDKKENYAELETYLNSISGGPKQELSEVDKMMKGRHPEMEDTRSLQDQTKSYKETVDAIKADKTLNAEQKWAKISNLAKPAYSNLKFNEETEEYEFKLKPEFQNKVGKDLFGGLKPPAEYKNEAEFLEDVKKQREEIISNDPVLNQQALNIQTKLAPEFEKMAKEIASKYDMEDAAQVETAQKEFEVARKALFNKTLSESKVYRHIVEDIDKAISIAADKADLQFKRATADGFSGNLFRASDAMRRFTIDLTGAKGTSAAAKSVQEIIDVGASGAEALLVGFGAQTGKAFNATQIATAQLGVKGAEDLLYDYSTVRDPNKKVYIFNNGQLDFKRSGLKAPDKISAWDGIKREPLRDWKGKAFDKPQSAFGGELGGKWMTISEARKIQEDRKEKFKRTIAGDLDELKAFEETLELIPAADFSDGTSFKDIVLTTANVLPQVAISVVGAVAAPVTAGGSLVASTMFMAMQEYGNNYWDALETGLTEELGQPPTNEQILDALAEDKYSDQGTAAGWAAVSAILETGTGLRGAGALLKSGKNIKKGFETTRKAMETISKKSGYTGIKDMFVKTGKNQFKDMLRDGGSSLIKSGKSGIKEYMTEYSQELTGQASVGQALGGSALDRLDFKAANEAGTGGGIVGFILPGFGAMRRGSRNFRRSAYKQAAIGLNFKSAESYKQADKFFKQSQQVIDEKLSNGEITPEEAQSERLVIANTRNAAMSIPKNFSAEGRQETLDLLLKKKQLEEEIKNNDDVFVEDQKTELANVNAQLKTIQKIENAQRLAIKASEGANLNTNIIRAQSVEEVENHLNQVNPSGKGKKNSENAKGKLGIHVSKDPKTGENTIILNEGLIRKTGKWTTAQHEVLHQVLDATLSKNPRAVFKLENAIYQKLGNLDVNTFKDSNLRKRLDQYQQNKKLGKAVKAEETLTLFSEALASGDIKFERKWFEGAQDMIRRIFQQVAPNSALGKIKFETSEDVYKFMKDYNKSMRKGRFTRAQKQVSETGIDVGEELGGIQDKRLKKPTSRVSKSKKATTKPSLEEDFDNIIDEDSDMFNEDYMDDIDIIDEELPSADPNVIAKDVDTENVSNEAQLIQSFKPLVTSIANRYRTNAKFKQNRDVLIDELLLSDRGVLGLARKYTEKLADGSIQKIREQDLKKIRKTDPNTKLKVGDAITLGMFVNNNVGGINTRSIEIAAEVLGYAKEKTGPYKSPVPEGRNESESLRRTMGLFSKSELDQMRADREITIKEYEDLLEKSNQQVVKKGPNKGKTYGQVIENIYNKAKDKVTKGVLISANDIVGYLESEFRTKQFVSDIKDLMGTPTSDSYKAFINNNGPSIYNKLTQRQINKRFKEFKIPLMKPDGTQRRMTVGESQAIGAQVKDIKAGNPLFGKASFNPKKWETLHLNPKTGRPASKQTALAESVAEIIGFDATQQALQDADVLENLSDRNVTKAQIEAVTNEITNQTARGLDFKFSLDEGDITIEKDEIPNLQKELDKLNSIVLKHGYQDADGNYTKEFAEAIEQYDEKVQKLAEFLYEENPDLNTASKGFKGEVLGTIQELNPELYNLIKSKGTVLRSSKKGVKVYNKDVTDRMNANSKSLAKTIDSRILKAIGLDFLGYKNRILDPAGLKNDGTEGMYYKDVQEIKQIQFTEDLEKLGITPEDVILMNKDNTKLQKIIKPIFQATNLNRKKELLEQNKSKIDKANRANKALFKYIAKKIDAAFKNGDVDSEYIFQILQVQTGIAQGFRGLSGFDFMYLQEGNQYVEGKKKPSGDAWMKMSPDERVEVLESFEEIVNFKDRYEYHLPQKENKFSDPIEAQYQAAFGTGLSAYKDLTIKGEHLGANANTMAKIHNAIIEGKLTDSLLDEMFIEHTQLFGPTYIMDVIDAKGIEGGPKIALTSKEGIFRLTKFLKNNPKISNNLYANNGQKAFTKIGEVETLAEQMGVLLKEQKKAVDDNVVELKASEVLNVEDDMSMEDVLSKAATIDAALSKARKLNAPVKKIRVFDFDDTLATTKSNVLYTKPDGTEGVLTAEEFAEQGSKLKDEGVVFDFSEFNKVTKGAKGPLFNIAKKINEARGNEDLFVLTARAPQAQQAIYEFLKSQGIKFKKENIVGLGNSSGAAKANWIIDKAANGYNDFYFADDAYQNVQAVRDALEVIDVKSKVQQAKLKFSEDINEEFNNIIEQTEGVGSMKRYSEARAQVVGSSKGRFKFWIPPSAEDFLGLIYKTLGKGEIGDKHMAFYKKNLLDPYARAMDNLSKARLQLMQDFKALKKTLNVPKELTKKTESGFTNEQAVRVYLWNKNGVDIPGLSKRDVKELTGIVESNPTLQEFANKLQQINKEQYPSPDANWLVGNITSDLIQGLNTSKRQKYLQEWKQNADIIFSKENLNKLESLYGPKYREALENILTRMNSGKNRTTSGNRLTNRIMDYINASNAAIMFFNMRSAVLQTISAVNFINFGVNNPYKAGKAFANQPQYWKDFKELMNSDYLQDRRNGLRLNINESEIAEAAKTSKNKAKGVLNYILKKGYAPTQFADSFAIASGGATFYRNRINQLLKEGKSEKEAKEIAMREFRQIAEESQQSSDPSRISSQQASPLGRLVLMFANTPMQYARIQKRAFQDLANGRGDAKANISKIIYYGLVQNALFNGLQQALFAVGFGDDDMSDEEEKKVLNTVNGMLDSILRGLGVGGQTVSVVKNFLLDIYERSGRSRPEYVDSVWKLMQFSPPISSKISKLKQAAWHFDSKKKRKEIYKKGFSIDNPAYEASAKVISATTNIPLDRVLYKYRNMEAAMSEETEYWQKIALISGWPSWQINPEETSSKKKSTKGRSTRSSNRNKSRGGSTKR